MRNISYVTRSRYTLDATSLDVNVNADRNDAIPTDEYTNFFNHGGGRYVLYNMSLDRSKYVYDSNTIYIFNSFFPIFF